MRERRLGVSVLLVLMALPVSPAAAETAREVLDRAKALEDGERKWTDRTQRMTLIAFDAGGAKRERQLHVVSKRAPLDEEKTLTFLLAPPEVKGTGFLQWSHRDRDDEQWLYLPEFGRDRQVSAKMKDESFVGTDFTYRDLEIVGKILRWTESEAPTRLVGEESVGDRPCYTIELQPKQEGTPYKKIVLALDRERLVARKLSFFDGDGANVKVLTTDDWHDVDSIPTPHHVEMRNLKKGSHTVVTLEEVKFNTNLDDDRFTRRYLDRGAP